MNVPVLVLLGFAAWTLLTLFGSIGVYRWRRILTGRASIAEWRADLPLLRQASSVVWECWPRIEGTSPDGDCELQLNHRAYLMPWRRYSSARRPITNKLKSRKSLASDQSG